MNRPIPLSFAILSSIVLFDASSAPAQDWPQWLGPNRDAKATGFDVPNTWPEQLTKKWQVKVGDGVATPSLVGDRLYVFSRDEDHEITRCLDADDGKELWRDSYETAPADGPAAGFAGPRATPTVSNGKVVTLGVRGTISCLNAADGKLLWRKESVEKYWPQFYTSSSPIVAEEMVIAQLGSEKRGAVVAYELATGDEVWKWNAEGGTAYASPVLDTVNGNRAVVVETSGKLAGLSLSDGEVLWEVPFPGEGRHSYNMSTPLVHDDTVIYAGVNRGMTAIEIEAKRTSPRELWSNRDDSVRYNTPVLKDGLLYAISDRDELFCLDAETGKTHWKTSPWKRSRVRGYGSVVDAGSVLVALNPSGRLIVFQPGAEKFQQVASYEVAQEEAFAYPVLSGNRIFIKDQDHVTLWSVE